MTCPHCDFENLEERGTCFRCCQGLDLSDIDVTPQRLKRGAAVAGLQHRVAVRVRAMPTAPPRLDAFLCAFFSIVPGLGQVLAGRRLRGCIHAALWVLAVSLAWLADPPVLLNQEVVLDWLLHPRWLPITTHAWIIADAWQSRLRQRGERAEMPEILLVTLVATFFLATPNALLLLSATRDAMLSLRTVRVQYDVDDTTVSRNDLLLVHDVDGAPGELRVGDVVVMRMERRATIWVQRMGTVHAVAGNVVAWSAGGLTVNGVSREVPPHVRIPDARLVLQPGEILVFPLPGEPLSSLRDGVVQLERVESVVLRITEPAPRRRILRTR